VVLPIAETTTTSWLPGALSATRRATFAIFSASATDDPPNFWTSSAIAGRSLHDGSAHRKARGPGRLAARAHDRRRGWAWVASVRLTCSRRRERPPGGVTR